MLSATFIDLVFIPIFSVLVTQRFRGKKANQTTEHPPVPPLLPPGAVG
jgi:hypothetical protein